MKIVEVTIDNRIGMGSVSDSANIDYMGLRVLMRPSVFLKLAAGGITDAHVDNAHPIAQAVKNNQPIGSPFLQIRVPKEWSEGDFTAPAGVTTHEGRHRMVAIKRIEGDYPVETHLFISQHRARHITSEMKTALNSALLPESFGRIPGLMHPETYALKGPFFTLC